MNNKKIILLAIGAVVVLYGIFFLYRYIECNDRGLPHSVCVCKATGSSLEHCAGRSVKNLFN
ncbi:MAG: hypothetical protein FWF34_02440 [Alphaproteobacteria bacterium]|nr:hypothetical protein [Alphaproteobacteria bacterium]MCL2890089.1 hypothetical protein [Alphaproteobacteria bacterium]